jgi:Tol biopolymer transport system component
MKSRITTIAAGLSAGLLVHVGVTAAATDTSARAGGEAVPARTSKIAFVSSTRVGLPWQLHNELYVMNSDGSGQRLLAERVGLATPTWSPDGRVIAFQTRQWRGRTSINVVDADGTEGKRLARGGDPAWSPDGGKLAFVSGPNGNYEIYVMNTDGSRQQNLSRHPAQDSHPVWSPDGRRIAFLSTRDRQPALHGAYLYVMRADGSGLRRLTHDLVHGDVSPVWSPDGRTIRFGRYIVNADGSGAPLTTNVPLAGAWSPDGRKIAFRGAFPPGSWGSPRANYDVYVMNADGSGQRRLTRARAFDGDPVWSPDGRSIAFRSMRDGNAELYVMNPDGSGQRRLTRGPANEARFAWSPDEARARAILRGRVTIQVKGTRQPPTGAAARGRFTISGAISDRGRFVDRGGLIITRTLFGAKGTISINVGYTSPYPCQCNWRITKGTKAYAGLRGRGRESGLYLPRSVNVTMEGTVSR